MIRLAWRLAKSEWSNAQLHAENLRLRACNESAAQAVRFFKEEASRHQRQVVGLTRQVHSLSQQLSEAIGRPSAKGRLISFPVGAQIIGNDS